MSRRQRASIYAALGDEHRLAIVEELLLTDLTSGELGERVGIASNLLSHHVAVLESVGIVGRRRSDGDRRRRYITVRAAMLPGELVVPRRVSGRVLFACSRNSARSQLAAALFQRRTGLHAESAGSRPADDIHPRARDVAREVGIDLDGRPVGYGDVEAPDVIVSVCDVAGEEPPPFASSLRLHWSMPDPVSDGRIGAFRRARDTLDGRIEQLVEAMR